MRRLVLLMMACVLGTGYLTGQPAGDSGWVRIATVPSGAAVYVDGRFAGSSPVDSFVLMPGPHFVQVQRQSPFRWTSRAVAETVFVRSGELVEVNVRVFAEVVVRTEPSGASVTADGRLIGRTPMRVGEDQIDGMQVGFEEGGRVPVSGPADSTGILFVQLATDSGMTSPLVLTGPGVSGLRSETWTLTAGGAFVLSGVLAAVFRDRANDAAAAYQRTRDPQALANVRSYDRLAGASMVAVQVSLGAFVLLLTGL